MARRKKGDGTASRIAMNGPDVDPDEMIDFALARNREDAARASDAGESRQMIGDFLERTSLNKKAFAFSRTILKAAAKDTAKGMDIIRSVEAVLPAIRAHVAGQGTGEMELEPDEPDDLPKPSYAPDADFEAVLQPMALE